MNKWTGTGRLTKDVELATTSNGVSVARFTIAVNRRFTNADGEREADFINCVAWRKTAEILAKYCQKGDRIGVVGELQTRSYEAKDGSKRYLSEIIVEEIDFLEKKKEDEKTQSKPHLTPVDEDEQLELPF